MSCVHFTRIMGLLPHCLKTFELWGSPRIFGRIGDFFREQIWSCDWHEIWESSESSYHLPSWSGYPFNKQSLSHPMSLCNKLSLGALQIYTYTNSYTYTTSKQHPGVQGPLQQCSWAGRFQATLLLRFLQVDLNHFVFESVISPKYSGTWIIADIPTQVDWHPKIQNADFAFQEITLVCICRLISSDIWTHINFLYDISTLFIY